MRITLSVKIQLWDSGETMDIFAKIMDSADKIKKNMKTNDNPRDFLEFLLKKQEKNPPVFFCKSIERERE